MRRWRIHALFLVLGLVICAIPFRTRLRAWFGSGARLGGEKTVADRLAEFGDTVHTRLDSHFREIGVSYPPKKMLLVGLKHERLLEVWVGDASVGLRYLKTYPILGASGTLGPKLREGDRQVPEGIYKIESLNPNSHFHLAMRVGYPNDFDKEQARRDGRVNLGSDIMIHGGAASVGCLAMGDQAAEDLFVLAAKTGLKNVSVILAPVDFRVRNVPPDPAKLPDWTSELYANITNSLAPLKRQSTNASLTIGHRSDASFKTQISSDK